MTTLNARPFLSTHRGGASRTLRPQKGTLSLDQIIEAEISSQMKISDSPLIINLSVAKMEVLRNEPASQRSACVVQSIMVSYT